MKLKLPVPAAFHLRALPTCLVVMVGGILASTVTPRWVAFLLLGLMSAALCVGFVVAKTRRWLAPLCLVCLLVGACAMWRADALVGSITPMEGTCALTGRVCEMRCDEYGNVLSVDLDRLRYQGEYIQGKMRVEVRYLKEGDLFYCADGVETDCVPGEPVCTGDYLMVTGESQALSLRYYDADTLHQLVRGVYYTQTANTAEKLPGLHSLHADEKVRLAFYEALRHNMTDGAAGMAYAFLTGKTGYLDGDIKQGYRSTGTAHLLAVSGLHVGVLAAALLWLLRKMRAPRWAQSLALAGVLGVYSWLCGGTPSVLRASLLAVSATTATALGCYRDRPSLLALGGLVLLLVQPLWLFDMSFLLSYAAYYGIVMLYTPLAKLCGKLPHHVGEVLALNLAVTLSITPMSVYFFGGFSLLTIPLNFVLIPFMSALYVALLACSMFVIVLPTAGILLSALGVAVDAVNTAMRAIGQVGYWRIGVHLWQLPVWYAGVTLASPYCLWPNRVKYTAVAAVGVGIVVSVL